MRNEELTTYTLMKLIMMSYLNLGMCSRFGYGRECILHRYLIPVKSLSNKNVKFSADLLISDET